MLPPPFGAPTGLSVEGIGPGRFGIDGAGQFRWSALSAASSFIAAGSGSAVFVLPGAGVLTADGSGTLVAQGSIQFTGTLTASGLSSAVFVSPSIAGDANAFGIGELFAEGRALATGSMLSDGLGTLTAGPLSAEGDLFVTGRGDAEFTGEAFRRSALERSFLWSRLPSVRRGGVGLYSKTRSRAWPSGPRGWIAPIGARELEGPVFPEVPFEGEIEADSLGDAFFAGGAYITASMFADGVGDMTGEASTGKLLSDGVGDAAFAGTAARTGDMTAAGSGAMQAAPSVAFTADGSGALIGALSANFTGAFTSDGVSGADFAPAGTSQLSSDGTGALTAQGASNFTGTETAAGQSAATFQGRTQSTGVLTAAGSGTLVAAGDFTASQIALFETMRGSSGFAGSFGGFMSALNLYTGAPLITPSPPVTTDFIFINTNFDQTPVTRGDAGYRSFVLDAITNDFIVGGVRESANAFADSAGNILDMTLLDSALSDVAARGKRILFRLHGGQTWSEAVSRNYYRSIIGHFKSIPAIYDKIDGWAGPNEPDAWTTQQIINQNMWLYQEAKTLDPDKPVVSSPMKSTNAAAFSAAVAAGLTTWCDWLACHAYAGSAADNFAGGGVNTERLKLFWEVQAANPQWPQRPGFIDEWGADSQVAAPTALVPSVVSPFAWKAAAIIQEFVYLARYGIEKHAAYSLATSGAPGQNYYNYPGFTKVAGEPDGPREPAYTAISTYNRASAYDWRNFNGFSDAQVSVVGTPYLYPHLVNFYSKPGSNQSVGDAWFYEWTRASFNAAAGTHTQLARTGGTSSNTLRLLTNLTPGRPVTLTSTVTVSSNGTATLALCGADRLDGDADVIATAVPADGTKVLQVTAVPTMTQMVCLWKYSGTGQADWSAASISVG